MIVSASEHKFKIKKAGSSGNYLPISNMTGLTVNLNKQTETFYDFRSGGFQKGLTTAMGITFNFDLKLDYEAVSTVDGNGLLREILFEIGSDTILDFEWVLPDGDTYTGEASFRLQSIGGEATAIDGGSVEAIVLGKPEKTSSATS